MTESSKDVRMRILVTQVGNECVVKKSAILEMWVIASSARFCSRVWLVDKAVLHIQFTKELYFSHSYIIIHCSAKLFGYIYLLAISQRQTIADVYAEQEPQQ